MRDALKEMRYKQDVRVSSREYGSSLLLKNLPELLRMNVFELIQ